MTAMAHLKLLLLLLWVGITVSTGVDLHKRIYGGQKCPDTERRYHVTLMAKHGTSGNTAYLCGGSLIHERWILTAAHCWKNEPGWDMYVTLGVHPQPSWIKLLFQRSSDKKKEVEITGRSFFVGINTFEDIMLLEIPPQTGRKTVALPDCAKPPKEGDVVQVAGLGGYMVDATGHTLPDQPPHLQCANMHVVDCEPTRNSACHSDVPYDNRLCLEEPNVDARHGDSGGGVIYNNMIYGVISGGGKRVCTEPVVTVNVCPYMNWINQKINPKSNGK
ncbi:unnamed protein product [Oreochromis niloticus]|nr:unnamed protein product [Mustela putorius furo]